MDITAGAARATVSLRAPAPHPLGACQARSMARARDSAGAVAAATRRRRLLRARLAPPRPPARPFPPPPPRGLPRPRCAAGPVTLAQRPPRSFLRSWPPLASCFSRSVRQQSASPGQARRRGDPTGSAGGRACARGGGGGAGSAARELLAPPSRRSRRDSPVSCHWRAGPEGRLCVSGARAGLVVRARAGTHPPRRDTGLSAAVCSRSGRSAQVAGPGRSEGGGVAVRCRGTRGSAAGGGPRCGRTGPSSPAKTRPGATGQARPKPGFLRKWCSRSRVRVSSPEPQRLVASSVAETFLLCGLKLAHATSCFVVVSIATVSRLSF